MKALAGWQTGRLLAQDDAVGGMSALLNIY